MITWECPNCEEEHDDPEYIETHCRRCGLVVVVHDGFVRQTGEWVTVPAKDACEVLSWGGLGQEVECGKPARYVIDRGKQNEIACCENCAKLVHPSRLTEIDWLPGTVKQQKGA